MPVGPLHFDAHLKEQTSMFGAGAFAARQAENMHALAVFDPLRDAAMESIACADTLSVPAAQFQLRHGAARRLLMTWRAYRSLIFCVPADRTDPVPHDELNAYERDLNVIYMNVVGVMDNYAWAAVHEFGQGTPPPVYQVGLFGAKLASHNGLVGLADVVAPFQNWNRDLRQRRDPVAHRIPLTIPPAYLDPAQAAEYEALGQKYWQAVSALNFETASAINEAQGKLGSFVPMFMHDPAEAAIPLYPTMPEDLAQLIDLMSALHGYFDARLGASDNVTDGKAL